jgi:preprotein translocase subunit SecF
MTATALPTRERRGIRGTLADIYHERTHFDFIGRSWRWVLLSGLLIVISVGALALNGLNLGIDFEGGTQWQFKVISGSASASGVRDALKGTSVGDPKVLIIGDDGVRVQVEELKPIERARVTTALAKYAGVTGTDVNSFCEGSNDAAACSLTDVGPTWGDQVSRKALTALVVMFVLIALYLTFRFEWKMAIAAILAVIHDIVITIGVYAVTGFEVTPATVVAVLTILGFSLYDTVVVFDKVKENTPSVGTERGDTYSQMVNRSMNQVLMRSLNTSFVALLPVASLLIVGSGILGAVTLRDFALALFVGLLAGAYSSIFVATPFLAWLKEREPRYRAMRERSAAQLAREVPVAPVAAAPAPAGGGGEGGTTSSPAELAQSAAAAPPSPPRAPAPSSRQASGAVAPRPRQQRRRKRR